VGGPPPPPHTPQPKTPNPQSPIPMIYSIVNLLNENILFFKNNNLPKKNVSTLFFTYGK